MDLSLRNIWKSWLVFKSGKRASSDILCFQYKLLENILQLYSELNSGTYKHGYYKKFVIHDNKKREIAVAGVQDRIVHRLIYDFLVPIYDKTFSYDAWSCRVNKGLLAAIQRANGFLESFPNSYVLKCDVSKFFNNVDQNILFDLLKTKVTDEQILILMKEVIFSYNCGHCRIGIPIGNLTSQIFANIYLNELDRFVKYQLKPKAYLRYGDDFILVDNDFERINEFNLLIKEFLQEKLKLRLKNKNNVIIKARSGLKFLGVIIWPNGKKLNGRNIRRMGKRLNQSNFSSYRGLVHKLQKPKFGKYFDWLAMEKFGRD